MSLGLVTLCYGSAITLALFLLWHFGAQHWYWHAASIVLALGIGLAPGNEFTNTTAMTLVIGWVFSFLMVWGVAAPVFAVGWDHHQHHWKHH